MLSLRPTPVISEQELRDRIHALAGEIVAELGDSPLVVAGLLRGCFVFMADLLREIARHGGRVKEVDFLVVSSYGNGMESTRVLDIQRDLGCEIEGETVLVVDDIIDTGHTLNAMVAHLQQRSPKAVKTVALLDKPSRREVGIDADFTGFQIDNLFVVGYGLDYAQQYRELPYITVMEEVEDE